jgi:hypothetical protein
MADTAARFDHRNRKAYLRSFIESFSYLYTELADPGRFPGDSRDDNGFWVPFRAHGVHGEFHCPKDDSCSWKSKELQVDVLIRYNRRTDDGEVKIDREYRQRCPKHGGHLVFPRLDEEVGAKMVMMKTKNYIQKKYYGGPSFLSLTNNRTRNSTGSSSVSSGGDSTSSSTSSRYTDPSSGSSKPGGSLATSSVTQAHSRRGRGTNTTRRPKKKLPLYKPVLDHSRENCEACILRHCPYPNRDIPDWQFMMAGSEVNNRRNLIFINWNLVDSNDIVLASSEM